MELSIIKINTLQWGIIMQPKNLLIFVKFSVFFFLQHCAILCDNFSPRSDIINPCLLFTFQATKKTKKREKISLAIFVYCAAFLWGQKIFFLTFQELKGQFFSRKMPFHPFHPTLCKLHAFYIYINTEDLSQEEILGHRMVQSCRNGSCSGALSGEGLQLPGSGHPAGNVPLENLAHSRVFVIEKMTQKWEKRKG